MLVLKKRAEFLAVARGGRVHKPALTLQYLSGREATPARFGLTVTKKTGNAVMRSRIKRRLRAAIMQVEAKPAYDYVIIARESALTLSFKEVVDQLQTSLQSIKIKG